MLLLNARRPRFAVESRFQPLEMSAIPTNRPARVAAPLLLALLLASCNRGLPTKLDHLPANLSNPELRGSGIYADGWIGGKASLDLRQPNGDQIVLIRGEVPVIGESQFRSNLELLVDGEPMARWEVRPGNFAVSAPVPTGSAKRRLTVVFSKLQQLPGSDGRSVGARLSFIGFAPKSATEGEPSDITRGLNLQLGSGWGVLETFHNETFRWIENDAHIVVAAEHGGDFVLSMIVEPGPGVGGKPFLLKLLDGAGRQVSAEPVRQRERVNFIFPMETGKTNEFQLHLDGGGKPTPNDPRILNFRVFEVEAKLWEPVR